MSVVYIISAYRLPRQLVRLVTRLQCEGVSFLIHLDKKVGPEVVDPVVEGLGRMPNVHFLERHVCHWGGFGHVAASLAGISTIIKRGLPCDQAVLLTGQDYPIKSNPEIVGFLAANRERSFLNHFPLPHDGWAPGGGMRRIDRWHFWVRGRHHQLPTDGGKPRRPAPLFKLLDAALPIERRFLPGLRPYGGSGYWCLSAEAIAYVHRYVQTHPEFVRFFRRVLIPDELFFQTLLLNSPLREEVIDDDLRHIVWPLGDADSPAVLGVGELPALKTSSALFARKFDMDVDSKILQLIDDQLL
jgi:hypothetical protein